MTTHEMQLVDVVDEWEQWYCFTCGRTIRIRWEPFKRVVIKAGEDVPHSACKGGLKIGSVEVKNRKDA